MADLPDILKGPGSDLLMGLAAGAFMGNPLLGLGIAPYLNQKRRGNEAEMERADAETQSKLFELQERQRLSQLAQDIPMLANAGKNPVTGEPVAMEEGMDPYMDQGQRLGLAAQFPSIANTLLPQQSNRMNPAQLWEMFTQKMGREPTPEEAKAIMGLNTEGMTPRDQLEFMRLRLEVEKLTRDLAGEAEEDVAAEAAGLQNTEALAYELQTMGKALDNLEGSPLAPGGGYVKDIAELALPVAQYALEMFGEDEMAGRVRQWRDSADLFKKSSSRFAGNLLQQMNAQGITVTRGLQQLVENMGANEDITIGSIRVINQMAAKEILKSKFAEQLDPETRQFLQQTAQGYDGNFGTMEEAEIAIEQGLLLPGDTFYINGEPAEVY